MKMGHYNVYLLLAHDGNFAKISSATCECVAGYVTYVFYAHKFTGLCAFSLYAGNRQVVLMCLQFFMPFLPLLQQLFS